LQGAANRDPRRFPDPDRLDVGRSDGASMSFGTGIHFCLGAALARVEGQVVFGRLLERYSNIELLDDNPRYRDSITLRGLAELPVRLTAA
ncbi:MAG: cytochrome P450, partial [Acidimicrobiia bacterium]|nr:cytochrome P450 [Acidimicrobiia bacterium]